MVVLVPLNRRSLKEAQNLERALVRSKPEAINAARGMLFLCKAVDLTVEPLYSGPALDRALWRYEALWLPLLVALSPAHAAADVQILHSPRFDQTVEDIRTKNSAKGGLRITREDLAPPIDIAWVWHCHRLNPHMYANDIMSLSSARIPIDATYDDAFRFSDGEDAQSKRLRRLWDLVYPFESFMPRYLVSHSYEDDERYKRRHITTYSSEKMRMGYRSVLRTERIARIVAHQRIFLWQVVGDSKDPAREALIETNEYLGRAFDRYVLFLALHRQPQHTALVPMNDINIMWHAHLSCSHEYKQDCQALLGHVLRHDTVADEDRRARRLMSMRQFSVSIAGGGVGSDPGSGQAPDPGSGSLSESAAGSVATAGAGSVPQVNARATASTSGTGDTGAGAPAVGALASYASDPSLGAAPDHRLDDDDDDTHSLGLASVELAELDEEEREELLEKRKRVVSILDTRKCWERVYGANPRYDLPDTLYRGEPEGERGGFYDLYVKQNGASTDLTWPVAFVLMVGSCSVLMFGLVLTGWAFYRAMAKHGKFLLGMPLGLSVAALGIYLFLAVPVNRPLSSDARYWLDRSLKQTHNPLPPFLVSSTKHE